MKRQLTPHFHLDEFIKSYTAKKLGISNNPTPAVVSNLRRLCWVLLEPIRAEYGHPVRISSGYRSVQLNKAVNGVVNSYHTSGRAADIYSYDLDSLKTVVYRLVSSGEIRPTEYIVYPNFIHLAL